MCDSHHDIEFIYDDMNRFIYSVDNKSNALPSDKQIIKSK